MVATARKLNLGQSLAQDFIAALEGLLQVLCYIDPEPTGKDTRTLYAVAIEGWNRRTRKWVADIVYIHALNVVHARNQYYVAHPNRRTSRIVAIGPVVGMFADDEEGKVLYTDEGFR